MLIHVQVEIDDLYWNLILFALANLPGNILSFLTIDRVGRIPSLISSLALSAASLFVFAWYASHTSTMNATAGIVWSSCAFQALETVAWNVVEVATGELFPTAVRSTGIGICTATGRLGAMTAQVSPLDLGVAGISLNQSYLISMVS